jgi:hypothetical protein
LVDFCLSSSLTDALLHSRESRPVPLFWSQSPYSASSQLSLKPAPTLDRPVNAASTPAAIHFEHLVQTYGPQTIVVLSEVGGKEGAVTNGYRELIADLAEDDVQWREFDFHHECQGTPPFRSALAKSNNAHAFRWLTFSANLRRYAL